MNRELSIDILKSFCMLEIVAYWHIKDYGIQIPVENIGGMLTIGALSTFFFISGVLSNKSYDGKIFYLKRLFRLYIPYIIAYILLGIVCFGFPSYSSILLDLMCINGFCGTLYPTLWFVPVLIFYNIITPFLLRINEKYIRFAAEVCTSILLYILSAHFNVDRRYFVYWFPYAVGLFFKTKDLDALKNAKYYILIISLLLFVVEYCSFGNFCTIANYCYLVPSIVVGGFTCVLLYLSFSFILSGICKQNKSQFFFIVSYSSFFVYLFHRVFYSLFFNSFTIFSVNYRLVYILIPFIVVLMILFSYMAQKEYNIFIKRIFKF